MDRSGSVSAPGPLRFFATAAKGTEPALRDELRAMRFWHVRADRGGVHFEGALGDGMRACLPSRIAMRVLLERGRFAAKGEQALYDGVRALGWDEHASPRHTISVTATCRRGRGLNEDDRSRMGMDRDIGSGVVLRRLVAGTGWAA